MMQRWLVAGSAVLAALASKELLTIFLLRAFLRWESLVCEVSFSIAQPTCSPQNSESQAWKLWISIFEFLVWLDLNQT